VPSGVDVCAKLSAPRSHQAPGSGFLIETGSQSRIGITLGQIGPGAKELVPELAEFLGVEAKMVQLHDRSPKVRQHAAWALGRTGPAARDAAPELLKLLKDEDVREAAAYALSKIGTDR
jgi:HEAT repeat protein